MQSFDDDQESGGSQDGSSDEDQTDRIDRANDVEEAEAEEDGEEDGDGDEDGEEEDDEEGGDDQGDAPEDESPSKVPKPPNSQDIPSSLGEKPHLAPDGRSGSAAAISSPYPKDAGDEAAAPSMRITVREEALSASAYDIVPTIAAPHSTSINVVTATPDLRWVFSGGSDGYIRKFNWLDTANSKLMLTVAQRHPFVDSVTKAGVLVSYWENDELNPRDDGSALSPVYSLAVHNQALWLLSGLDSGGINLQSVRHEEGKRVHYLKKHTSAVSVLNLAQDERSVLSGSWDKTVLDWDLDTGQVKRAFVDGAGQISALEMRPLSSLPVPETAPAPAMNGTLSSNNEDKPQIAGSLANSELPNGIDPEEKPDADNALSPVDSLFGGGDDDDLFGENNDIAPPVNLGDEEDNEFSRAMAQDIREGHTDGPGDVSMADAPAVEETPTMNGTSMDDTAPMDTAMDQTPVKPEPDDGAAAAMPNGLPHAAEGDEGDNPPASNAEASDTAGSDQPPIADTTFLAASHDGTIRIWDKRKPSPVAKIVPRNTPPWCMGACWSPDGNYIYAGRRNGTVEEFSLHKGFRAAERTFRFPNGSGPVSAVRAMPNGRHLVCASYDILRLYDLQQPTVKHASVPFLIVPGHRTGVISQLFLDQSCRFMISTAGSRGWDGNSTQVLLGYEINCEK